MVPFRTRGRCASALKHCNLQYKMDLTPPKCKRNGSFFMYIGFVKEKTHFPLKSSLGHPWDPRAPASSQIPLREYPNCFQIASVDTLLPRLLCQGYIAQATQPRLRCQVYTAKVTLPSLHSQGYTAKVMLPRLRSQGYTAKVTLPRLRSQGYIPKLHSQGFAAKVTQPR